MARWAHQSAWQKSTGSRAATGGKTAMTEGLPGFYELDCGGGGLVCQKSTVAAL